MPQAFDTIRALDFPPEEEYEEPTNVENITGTSFAAGTPVCGGTFIAGATGAVEIEVYGVLRADGNGILLSYELYEGSSEAGTQLESGSDANAIEVTSSGIGSQSASKQHTGLAVGATHFVRTVHRVRGGTTQDVLHRRIIIRSARR